MEPELKIKWIEALRSGAYEQGPDQLVLLAPDPGGEPAYCCLGVLCDIMGDVEQDGDEFLFPLDGVDTEALLWDDEFQEPIRPENWQGDNDERIVDDKIVAQTMIPTPIARQMGLAKEVDALDWKGEPTKKELRNELASMNDSQGKNFLEIADYLESIDF